MTTPEIKISQLKETKEALENFMEEQSGHRDLAQMLIENHYDALLFAVTKAIEKDSTDE